MTIEGSVDVTSAVREKYARAAAGMATSGCCGGSRGDPITASLYGADQTAGLPDEAVRASLGCGNPTALLDLQPGQVVLDLGSGGGLDVLLSARRVGPAGKVYGLDMTDEMLALARENQRKAGVENVEFLKGEIEAIPLPDASVDVVISNCVINLSPDKAQVLREVRRVLKPGGRFAVSDVVVRGEVPPAIRRNVELWAGCVAGALEEEEYRRLLEAAGFEHVEIEPWRVYDLADARAFLREAGVEDVDAVAASAQGRFASAFVHATKPAARASGVLFLCTGNSARSLMAEALLNHRGRGRFKAFSAGSHPKGAVHPMTIEVLRAHGLPTAGLRSKPWDEFAAPGAPRIDFVFTVCDRAASEACPIWPGQPITAHWGVEDPAAAEGLDDAKRRAFEHAFQTLDARIKTFASLRVDLLDRLTMQRQLDAIGHDAPNASGADR